VEQRPLEDGRRRAVEELQRIVWLLSVTTRTTADELMRSQPAYGDLTELNSRGEILEAVGRKALLDIATEFIGLLDTSMTVHEANGDYAAGIFTSGWCRLLDEASRRLCNTKDNREALDSGQWHCRESCWPEASKMAIETGEPADVECRGGIRLYALPIRAGDELIGAVNFGYGDPPTAPERLGELARTYSVDLEELKKTAEAYKSRPKYIIDLAKRRLQSIATLIGEIVKRRRAEEELKESKARYQDYYDNAPDMAVSVSAKTAEILDCNQTLANAMGYTKKEIIGRPIFDMYHPDCMEDVEKAFQSFVKTGEVRDTELQLKKRDGTKIDVELNVTAARDEEGNTVRSRSSWRDITKRKRAEAEAARAQQALLDQQRRETERVEAALERARAELVRKTRLATIGQVSASIAHELRNPLGSVRNAVYYLKRHTGHEDPSVAEFLDVIDEEVNASDRVIGNLLEMTRARAAAKRTLDLAELVEDVFSKAKDVEHVSCRFETVLDPFEVHADPDQLRQVIVNIVDNAVQAMQGHGELVVNATRTDDYDVIAFHDSGRGVPPDVRESLFDPLVTTKAKGIGLGLTICKQIIEGHDGTINVVDHEQGGAAFQVRLPRHGSVSAEREGTEFVAE